MTTESTEFQELFGASSVRESMGAVTYTKPEPQLPTDNELWLLEVPTGNAAQQIQDEEFIKALSGHEPSAPLSSNSEPGELLELMKRSSNSTLSRKKTINARLDARLYKHELRDRWNSMLEKFAAEGADTLPDAALFRKAIAFLGY